MREQYHYQKYGGSLKCSQECETAGFLIKVVADGKVKNAERSFAKDLMRHFIPVKITNKQWADKLVQGEVFMRALHEFGSWGNVNEKDTVLNNDFRGDFFAGVTATFKCPDDSDYFKGFPPEVKAHMVNCCLVDESDVQFFKIFSLYCYELDDEKQRFKTPDPRMAQFGDTAVLITDFCEFIERFGKAMFSAHEKVISMIGVVESFGFSETRYLNPLFWSSVKISDRIK